MRPEPETFTLARIEPRLELSVHLLPFRGSHGLCGVSIWDSRKVEPVDFYSPSLTIDEFLPALRRGEIEVGDLTCERCLSALAIRERDS